MELEVEVKGLLSLEESSSTMGSTHGLDVQSATHTSM